jgi:hypothetical protein
MFSIVKINIALLRSTTIIAQPFAAVTIIGAVAAGIPLM